MLIFLSEGKTHGGAQSALASDIASQSAFVLQVAQMALDLMDPMGPERIAFESHNSVG
jgi:hypothetical protein